MNKNMKEYRNNIKVLKKDPGEDSFRVIEIGSELDDLQKEVGGWFECIHLSEDADILVNEEGRLMGMPYNCTIGGYAFVGPVLIVGVNGDNFASVDANSVEKILEEVMK